MDERDVRDIYAGVFADTGYWVDSYGEVIEISEMSARYKANTIYHLIKALPRTMEVCGRKMISDSVWFIAGKFAKDFAKKIEELGGRVLIKEYYCVIFQDEEDFDESIEASSSFIDRLKEKGLYKESNSGPVKIKVVLKKMSGFGEGVS